MKKFLLSLFCLCSFLAFAEDQVGSYNMSYFDGREFKIEASEPKNGSFVFYIYVAGERESERVCLALDSKNLAEFKTTMLLIKEKYIEWKEKAEANNVTDVNKDFPYTLPKMDVAWAGSKWWFAWNRKFTPTFFVFKSGKCACVITAKVTASSNQYIDQKFYFVLETAEEFDALLNALDENIVNNHYENKGKATDLFD